MNEASSKFVDNLVIEKLLGEKLSKVSHSPRQSYFNDEEFTFKAFENYKPDISGAKYEEYSDGLKRFIIPSYLSLPYYPENNNIYLYYHPAEKPVGNIILVHGLYDDSMFTCAFFIKMLNDLNLNVFYMVLPYHYNRKPAESLFSGEYFLSADIYRTKSAFKQAVYDIHTSFQFIDSLNALPTIIVGYSIGGCISFRYYTLNQKAVGLFLINPASDISSLIWENPLMSCIRKDLEKCEFDFEATESIFRELDPVRNLPSRFDTGKVIVAYSVYDQIVEKEGQEKFIERAGFKKVQQYQAGHLNIFRVPRLSKDVYNFFVNLEK